MKKILLIPVILLVCGVISARGQSAAPEIGDLSDASIDAIYACRNDTLGFRILTPSSPREFQGKENRRVKRQLRSLTHTLDRNTLFHSISGASIESLQKQKIPPATHMLRNPKYRIAPEGIILIGKHDISAEWNDMVFPYPRYTLNIYHIDYKGNVRLDRTVSVDKGPASLLGIINFDPEEMMTLTFPESKTDESKPVLRQDPEYPGGTDQFMRYIRGRTTYRVEASDKGISGTVVAGFTVEPDGSITNIHIIRDPDRLLSKEVERVLGKMPNWTPGKQNGEPIAVEVTIQVFFEARRL